MEVVVSGSVTWTIKMGLVELVGKVNESEAELLLIWVLA
jgi:hypothetical protein